MVRVAPNGPRLAKQWSTRKEPARKRKLARERKKKLDEVERTVQGKYREGSNGSRAGVPNKITRIMKDALVLAAEAVGADGAGEGGLIGYLESIARSDREIFCMLLGKLLPIQMNSRTENTLNFNVRSPEEILKEMAQRGLKLNGTPLQLVSLPELVEPEIQTDANGADSGSSA